MNLYPFQKQLLQETENFNRCAYYADMGLGKTFIGAEKMHQLGCKKNLLICQKTKVQDWIDHFQQYYPDYLVLNLTKKMGIETFMDAGNPCVGIINYDIVFRRPVLFDLRHFTLLLDESSLISNEKAQRSKTVLRMKPDNIILLSGTPVDGKYEKLWSQCRLLGWNISKDLFYTQFVIQEWIMDNSTGFQIPKVVGYKNVDRLKKKLAEHGAVFLKSEEVIDLPEQQEIIIHVPNTREYRKFMKDRVVDVQTGDLKQQYYRQLIGDTPLTKRIYARQLCGQYNKDKLNHFRDLLRSTADRLIVFYNFNDELSALEEICEAEERPVSYLNGKIHDLEAYDKCQDSVTLVQYQAGAMGVNLQKADKVIYFSLPEKSELFEQSKKRIHRIGQKNTCFYYILLCPGVEADIYKTLQERKDYTDALFEKLDS